MRSTLLSKPMRLATLLFLSGLTGCVTTAHGIPTSGTNPVCLAAKPLTFSKNDTAETKEEVRQINAVLRSVCPQFATHGVTP